MFKPYIQEIVCGLVITLLLSSFVFANDKIKDAIINSSTLFIIDYNVNLYKDKGSTDVQKKITFFDPITVLSEDVSPKGRINVKLQDGTEGWVEEKYTSYIPKNWKKLVLFESYYCFNFSNKKLNIKKEDDEYGKMYYYLNSDIDIAMGVVFLKNYKQNFNNKKNMNDMQIQGGHAKELNWNKEFTFGNYKVNYIITTDHEDGGICEYIDFAKLDELDLKKYYTVGIDYMPYTSDKKKLLWRKILFSTLQSLK